MFEDLEKTFSRKVEEKVLKTGNGYMETINLLCDEMSIEPELAAKYLSKPIIEKIRVEAENINLLHAPRNYFQMGLDTGSDLITITTTVRQQTTTTKTGENSYVI